MSIQIRDAHAGDLPALGPLWEEFMDFHAALDSSYERVADATDRWFKYIEPQFNDEDICFLVAEASTELVGFVTAMIRDHPPVFESTRHGVLESIAVRGTHRGQGIGRLLYREAEKWLCSKGIFEITVRIDERNPASQGLFADAGFEPSVTVRRKLFHQPDGPDSE